MKILFTGLPYFGKKLVADLTEFDRANRYVFCDTYYSRADRFRFIFHLFTADVVISFNGVSNRSKSLDWAIRFKKKLILQWHGSDVLTAKANIEGRGFLRKYIDYGTNYTDAAWLVDELHQLGIEAQLLHFKHVPVTAVPTPFKTADLVTYIAEGKEEFYGIGAVNALAWQFPEVKFHVTGTSGKNCVSPPNVVFYGWVDQSRMKELLNEHALFGRFTAHDGYSLSVMEAIANGNYVLWTQPHAQVFAVENRDFPGPAFQQASNVATANALARNDKNLEWARQNLSREKVLSVFVKTVTRH